MREPETLQEVVVGLRLPDGTEVFPPENWHGRGLDTPEGRKAIFDSLVISEANLGFSPGQLLAQYRWVSRPRTTAIMWGDPTHSVRLSEVGYADSVPMPVPASPEVLSVNGEAME